MIDGVKDKKNSDRVNKKSIISSFILTFKYFFDDVLQKKRSETDVANRVGNISLLNENHISSVKENELALVLLKDNILRWKNFILNQKNIPEDIKKIVSNINEDNIEKNESTKYVLFYKVKLFLILGKLDLDNQVILGLKELNKNISDYKKISANIKYIYRIFTKMYSKFYGTDFIDKVDKLDMSYFYKIKLIIFYKEGLIEISEFLKMYVINLEKLGLLSDKDELYNKAIKKLNIVFLKDPKNMIKENNSLSKHHLVSSILFEELKSSGLNFSDLNKFGFDMQKKDTFKLPKVEKDKILRDIMLLYKDNYSNKNFLSKIKGSIKKKLDTEGTTSYVLYHNKEAIFSSLLVKEDTNTINWSAFYSNRYFKNYGFGFWFLEEVLSDIGEKHDITCEVNYKLGGKKDIKHEILMKAYNKYGFAKDGNVVKGKISNYQKLIRKKAIYFKK